MKMRKMLALFMATVMIVGSISAGNGKIAQVATKKAADGMVLVPRGTFTIGSPKKERLRGTDETSHQVTINSFYADPYEVTQKDYKEVMGKNPSTFKGNNKPVNNVTWYDAIRYCNKLSKKMGINQYII